MRSNWFSIKSWAIGVICALPLAALIGAETGAASVGRYQLSAWGQGGATGSGGRNDEPGRHGAYRLDTQTGEVWEIHDDGSMMQLGKSN